MANHNKTPQAEEDAASRLAADAAGLVREEITRLRAELATDMRRAGVGGGLLAAGGVFGLLALHAGSVALLRALESVMPPRRAALVLATGYLTAGAALTLLGVGRLRETGVVTRRAVSQVKQEVAEAAEATRRPPAEVR
ncbi:phage holin family protein [Microtetraspora fusca]|uniref:phage holin family protein n=1 Tax=Microtetraspora fusca TaxID=1997 RepID=UPI000B13810E|nr:phage holin family protein [Microtetraspora fusca]